MVIGMSFRLIALFNTTIAGSEHFDILFAMSQADIDAFLAPLDPVKRATLEVMRASILEILPGATQEIYYAMPAFMVEGKALGGFAAFKNHLSWIPYSGQVVDKVLPEIAPYSLGHSQGVFKFAVDKPLPKDLIRLLIHVRALDAFGPGHPLINEHGAKLTAVADSDT
jgi:uncharacterized protein YdhG (YjbR/CyaY superfamily)